MSVFYTFLGYFLFFVLQTIFTVFGIKYIFQNRISLQPYQEKYLLLVIVLCYVLNLMEKLVGFGTESRWFDMIIPLGNFSPFLFTLTLIAVFLPKKYLQPYRAVVGFMCIGMMAAGYYNTVTRILSFDPWLYTCIVFDNFGHVLIGLYGIYIIKSNAVTYTKKTKLCVTSFVFSVALLMLILNAVFHTSFFGLNLYGKHNIYNLVLTNNSIISALIYFAGLCVVLAVGWHFTTVVQKPKRRERSEK